MARKNLDDLILEVFYERTLLFEYNFTIPQAIEILKGYGVENADKLSPEELKRVYINLSRKYHPELGGSITDFQKIGAVYDTLRKSQKGNKQALPQTQQQQPQTQQQQPQTQQQQPQTQQPIQKSKQKGRQQQQPQQQVQQPQNKQELRNRLQQSRNVKSQQQNITTTQQEKNTQTKKLLKLFPEYTFLTSSNKQKWWNYAYQILNKTKFKPLITGQ